VGSVRILRTLSKACADRAIPPIGSRGEAQMPFEDLRQVALMRKTTLQRNLSEGHLLLLEQPLRSLETLAQHKLVRALSRRLAEQAGEMIRAEADLLRQYFEREILAEMRPNEIRHSFHLMASQLLFDLP